MGLISIIRELDKEKKKAVIKVFIFICIYKGIQAFVPFYISLHILFILAEQNILNPFDNLIVSLLGVCIIGSAEFFYIEALSKQHTSKKSLLRRVCIRYLKKKGVDA